MNLETTTLQTPKESYCKNDLHVKTGYEPLAGLTLIIVPALLIIGYRISKKIFSYF